jgi:predicted XRE-type DNA-binding protein
MIFWRIQNGGRNMSELVDKLRAEFQDEEYRHAYADECLDTMIATQIKVLREQRSMTQGQLAVATGMKQPRIPVLEDASYSNWTINTLKRFAKAFDVALSVKFETFSQVIKDFEQLSRESLQRPTFANDTQFQHRISRRFERRKHFPRRRRFRNWSVSQNAQTQISDMGVARRPPKSVEAGEGANVPQAAGQHTADLYLVAAVGGRNE